MKSISKGAEILRTRTGLVGAFLATAGVFAVEQCAQADGIVRCWGLHLDGQCTVPADLGPCTTVSAGGFHTIALQTDGTVRAWGDNDYGQCYTPTDLGTCSRVTGGQDRSIALQTGGTVRCWGNNSYGACATPVDLGTCSRISSGLYHTAAIERSCPTCQASLTGNCRVDGADLGILLDQWGTCPAGETGCSGDLNADGQVNGADLGYLLSAWGPCPN